MIRTRFDLGLQLLAVYAKPGVVLTQEDIAAWCGCTKNRVYLIERDIMKKLRDRFLFGPFEELTREIL